MDWTSTIIAQAGGGSGLMETLLLLGVIFLIFWFFMLRPQKKEYDRHQALVSSLKVGDEVVTAGGVFGKVASVDGDTVQLECNRGTKFKIDRQKIQKSVKEFEMEKEQEAKLRPKKDKKDEKDKKDDDK